ncbi:hypothetical protein KY349_04385, partial [Candidatus Woesearchaeota archaeon]|nr:hypothetical protein [Candidatus Woesearchaeota archaeon]
PLIIAKPQPKPAAKPELKVEAEPALVPVDKPEEKSYKAEPESIDDTIQVKEEAPARKPKETVAQKQEDLETKVKKNESPWSLADKYTGRGLNYKRIRRYGKTPIDNAHPLQPGEKAYIPKNILKREYRNKSCYSKNGKKRSRVRRRKRGKKNYSAKLYKRR